MRSVASMTLFVDVYVDWLVITTGETNEQISIKQATNT